MTRTRSLTVTRPDRANRGDVDPGRAGSTGLDLADDAGTEVDDVTHLDVVGAQLFELDEPGWARLSFGSNVRQFTNATTSILEPGTVVVIDDDGTITTTATPQDTRPVGIVQRSSDPGTAAPVLLFGYAAKVITTGSVTGGNFLETSPTAGQATQNATQRLGSFGMALGTQDDPPALIFGFTSLTSPVFSTGWFIPEDYGAVGNGTTDDTAAVAACVAAYNAAGGGVLYFPNKYLVTAGVSLTEPGVVLGGGRGSPSGAGTTSEIICNSATAVLFNVQDHLVFHDLQMRNTHASPTAGAAIAVTSTGDITTYDGCLFRGWYIGLDIQEGGGQNVHNCFFTGQVKYDAKIRNISGPDGGDHAFSNCWFYAFDGRTPDAAIRQESAGGTKITNCKINTLNQNGNHVHGYDLAASVASSSILIWHGNSVENITGDGIHIATSGFGWDHIIIAASQFGLFLNSTGNAIDIAASSLGEIDNVVIVGNVFKQTGGGSAPAINLTRINNPIIGPNARDGFGAMLAATDCTNVKDFTGGIANGVVVTGTPAAGDFPIASSSSAAAWGTPAPTATWLEGVTHAHVVSEQATGTGAVTVYVLDNEAEPDTVAAYVNGVRTDVTHDYATDPAQVTFATAPGAGATIRFDYMAAVG